MASTPGGTVSGGSLRLSVEPDFVLDIVTWDLEWIEVHQTGVGCLKLTTFGGDQLLKVAVLVPKRVSPNGELLRGRRIQEARGKAAETTVSERAVAFLCEEVLEVETEFVDTFLVLIFQPEVEEGIIEGATQ